MISKEITICINPGVDCHNIHVDWLGIEGLIVPCQDKNCITVAVDPSNPTQCLEGFIVCLDANGVQSCKNCEPIHFRKCFCTLDSDCGNCGKCGPDGICVDICSPSETAQGKVCYPDGCKCPPNKPILDPKTGKCAECISGTKDPANPCRICIDGKWISKSCGPDAVCDQSTGDCITDCSKNTNGRTKWNPVTKVCDCETGYRWSTVKNICVEDKPCDPGYRRNPVTDECEKITCPPGMIFSVEKNDCIEKPCDPTNCESGLDCTGVNCGCGPDGKCVSCKDNPNALGCKDDKTECKREYCDDTTPCEGKNCTCVDNKCVNCNNFPCDKCGLHEGCACTDGVNCTGDNKPKDCLDKHELKFDGCSLKTKLQLVNSCNCDGVGTSLKVNHFSKAAGTNSNTYKTEFEIDLRKKFVNNITGYELLERFKQSDVTINNDFPDVANCSIEITTYYKDKDGVVFSTPVQTLSSEIKTGATGVKETFVKFENVTIATDKPTDPISPTTFVGYRLTAYVGDINFEDKNCFYRRTKIYQTTNTGYESISLTTTPRYTTIGVVSTISKRNPILTIKRGNEIIRRLYVSPTSPGVYEDQINGPKKLSFYERGKQELGVAEGELISLRDYTTHWDCGCEKEKTIKEISKCDIKDWKNNDQFRIGTSTGSPVCNNQLTLLKEHVPCYINQDLEYFGWGGNHPSQTKYIVSIIDKKGATIVVGTFVYKNTTDTTGYFRKDGTNEQFVGYIYNHTEEITSVSIKMNHDTGCVLSDSISLDIKDAEINLSCIGDKVRATISSRGTAIKKVEIPSLNIVSDTSAVGTSQVILNNIPQNVDVKYIITYVNGCKKEHIYKKNCCDSDELELDVSGLLNKILTIKTRAEVKLKSIIINGTQMINNVTETNNIYVVPLSLLNNPETVSVVVITQADCTYTIEDFDCGESYALTMDLVPAIICPGESSILAISDGPPNTNVTVSTPNGSLSNLGLDNTGYGQITNLTTIGDYRIILVGTSQITDPNQFKKTLVSEITPAVSSMTLEGGGTQRCANTDVEIKVVGTLGSLVDIEVTKVGFLGQDSVLLNTPSPGSSTEGFGIFTYSFPEQGTYTVTATKVMKGRCEAIPTISTSVVVNQVPLINGISSECIAPFGPTADVKLMITLSNMGTGTISVTARNLTNNAITTLTAPSLANVFEGVILQAQGKTVEITVTGGACIVQQVYLLDSCNCTPATKPPAPVFDNYYVCLPGGSLDITNTLVGGGQYAIDLYFNGGTVPVKRLTNTDASYQISNSGQIGTYTPVSVNLATGCTTNGASFSVYDGSFMVDFNLNTAIDYCVGEVLPLMTATVSGGVNIVNMSFRWFINNIQVVGNTGPNLAYTPTDVGNKTIKVEAYRTSQIAGTVSNTCVFSKTHIANVIECCDSYVMTYNAAESGQCTGITIDVTRAEGGTPLTVLLYRLYKGSTLVYEGQTTEAEKGKVTIAHSLLALGLQTYRLELIRANGCTPLELNFSHNRCACLCNNNICAEVIDGAGSYFGSQIEYGYLPAGSQIGWAFEPKGAPDALVIQVNNTTLIDTGLLTPASTCFCNENINSILCQTNNGIPRKLGDDPQSVINLVTGTATVGNPFGSCGLNNSAVQEIILTSNIGGSGCTGIIGGVITLPIAGIFKVTVPAGNSFSEYQIKCVSIPQ